MKPEEDLNNRFGDQLKADYPLSRATTLELGGPAKFFIDVLSEEDLADAIKIAQKNKLKWEVIGEGSNLVVYDAGFDGLIIRNKIEKFEVGKKGKVVVGAGSNLLKTIYKLNEAGLAGLEKMAGIPGSVGGAVYGSAGAYGQEIQERVEEVRFYDAGKNKFKTFDHSKCGFGYRHSVFKEHKNWIITEITLHMDAGESDKLKNTSEDIIRLREKKYKPGIKCPGSFFKNIKVDEMEDPAEMKAFLERLDPPLLMYGKVPAGYLLEKVGAKGMTQGEVHVAQYHANLIYNPGGAKARDIKKLAGKLKKKVKQKFGILIEEEIQYLGEDK